MIKHPKPSPNEGYTPEERGVEMEDMIIERAKQILKQRLAASKVKASKEKKRLLDELKHARMLRKCRSCKAMKFYLKNGPTRK